jgi:ribonuclease Z
MLKNAPVRTLSHGGLTIEGYSRAAVQSYWCIPELKIGFDLGAHPWDLMGIPNWLISHCHLDHIAALPLYVARRRMMKMEPPRLLLQASAVEPVKNMLRAFTQLDRGRFPCRLVGLKAGQQYELSRELVVEGLEMVHRIPCLGYVIYDRRRKLKPELAGLSEDEIRSRRLQGEEVTNTVLKPLVGYTGDTSPRGLDNNPVLYECKVLITEMTFLSADHKLDFVHRNGHMHLDDFVARKDRFHNELVIASHVSTRYSRTQAERLLDRKLPDRLDGRLQLVI